jgi:hypothetical protein
MASVMTARTVASVKAGATAFYKTDSTIRGLQLRTASDGTKNWSVRYRMGKRQRRLTLGAYTVLSLADARAAAKRRSSGVEGRRSG